MIDDDDEGIDDDGSSSEKKYESVGAFPSAEKDDAIIFFSLFDSSASFFSVTNII